MIKTLNKLGLEGTYCNTTKAIYDKLTANVILSGERLKTFLPRSGKRQRGPFSPALLNIALEVIARAIRKDKKSIQIRKEEIKLPLFADDMILYTENPKTPQKILRINKFV